MAPSLVSLLFGAILLLGECDARFKGNAPHGPGNRTSLSAGKRAANFGSMKMARDGGFNLGQMMKKKRQEECEGEELCGVGCCPIGDTCCEDWCCDPEHPVCQADDFCCPAGMTRCAENPDYCHVAEMSCCPAPSTIGCYEGGECCEGLDQCCQSGEVCCDGWCCPEGSMCSAEEGYCIVEGLTKTGHEPSQTELGSSSKAKTTAKSTAESEPTLKLSTPKISTPKASETKPTSRPKETEAKSTPKPSSAKETEARSTPRPSSAKETEARSTPRPSSAKETEARSTPRPSSAKETSESHRTTKASSIKTPSHSSSSTSSSALPTLLFQYTPTYTDDLVKNMCLGLRSRLASPNKETLTYVGPGKGQRQSSRCKGGKCCTGQKKASGPNKGWKLTCDEYPFSSTQEGGKNAHVGCIPSFQNGAQGDYLKSFYEGYNMKAGDKFVVEILGIDCDDVKEDEIPSCNKFGKRADANVDERKGVFYPPDESKSVGRLIIPMDDLSAGDYHTTIEFPEGSDILDLVIIDNQGDEYSVSSTPSSDSTLGARYILSFSLPDDTYGAFIVASTRKSTLKVTSWDVKPGKASGSGNPTSTSCSTDINSKSHYKTMHPVRPSGSKSDSYGSAPSSTGSKEPPMFILSTPEPHTLHPIRPSIPGAPSPYKQDEVAPSSSSHPPVHTMHPIRPSTATPAESPSPSSSASSKGIGHMIYQGLGGKESTSSSSASLISNPTVIPTGGNSTYGSNATVTMPSLVMYTTNASARIGVDKALWAIMCLAVAMWLG